MRYLVLVAALVFTSSPALGQVQQQLPQWAKQRNASDQPRLGLTYDLDWDAPQNNAKEVRWKPILVGAATGLTTGFAFGWRIDAAHSGSSEPCIVYISDPHGPSGPCLNDDPSPYAARIVFSLVGLEMGGLVGWIWALIEAGAE